MRINWFKLNILTHSNCRICGASLQASFRHRLLGRHDVQYLRCDACGLLQTEAPYWLEEAYSSAIADCDTGLVQRNLQLADICSCLLWYLFKGRGRFLDAAGGTGLFTRLMRDIGFDYHWWDPHAENTMARGFDSTPGESRFAAVTAFEVLEHLTDPMGFLGDLRRQTGCNTLIASTELYRGEAAPADDWWYYAFETGQHISFYQQRTLQEIARRLELRLYSHRNIHVWTDRRLPRGLFRLMSHPRHAAWLSRWPRRRLTSRVRSDSELLAKPRS